MGNQKNILILAVIIAASLSMVKAAGPPSADDVEILSKASAKTFDDFIWKSFPARAHLQYSGQFADSQQALKTVELAETSLKRLKEILKLQNHTALKIEEYEGDDWEDIYGKTGLWKTSTAAARQTRWRICILYYHNAIASPDNEKEILLNKVIELTGKDSEFAKNERVLLNIKASLAAAPGKPNEGTIKKIDSIIASSNSDNEAFYQAVIMRMKLSSSLTPGRLRALAENLKHSKLKNNFELLFKLAIEELKAAGSDIIYSIASEHSAIVDLTSRIILNDILTRSNTPQLLDLTLKTKTPAEISLAAQRAIKERDKKYADIFTLCSRVQKFQSAPVYLAAAESCRNSEPMVGLEFYYKAAEKLNDTKNKPVNISARQIAQRRATLAYEVYYKNSDHFETARQALQQYLQLDQPDQIKKPKLHHQLEYLYASMTLNSPDNQKALSLLNKISGSDGNYAEDAAIDLMFYNANNSTPGSASRKELIIKTRKLIEESKPANKNRITKLYCKLLIEEGGKENAVGVLKMLNSLPDENSIDTVILKAAAHAETGNLIKALNTLLPVTENQTQKGKALAAAILTEILEDIDEYEDSADNFKVFISKCRKLAAFSHDANNTETQTEQFKKRDIEIAIFDASNDSERLKVIGSFISEYSRSNLEDIDWIRCRARLYMKQNRHAEAFRLWSKIAIARKPLSRSATKPPKWWRAKYYALKCYSKISDPENNDLHRAINILITTNKNIPDFWAKRLKTLK